MRKFFWRHDLGIKELLILCVVVLSGYTVYLHRQLVEVGMRRAADKVEQTIPGHSTIVDTCGPDCQKEIDKKVSATLKSEETPARSHLADTVSTKTSYISIGSTFVTRNTEWTDIPGQVTIDPAGYGASHTFSWDASVKIGNANGEVQIRLFDLTNGIAVSGSELSATASSYTNVTSGNLPFWDGDNTYKAQIRSTSGEEATFASGRIRVVYK